MDYGDCGEIVYFFVNDGKELDCMKTFLVLINNSSFQVNSIMSSGIPRKAVPLVDSKR